MLRVRFTLTVGALLLLALSARAQERLQIRGPIVRGRLAIYLVERDTPEIKHRYLTLDEAIKSKKARLLETGTTNLAIENISTEDIFIQSGEIVKGGQQDRMIANDMVVPPGMNQIAIPAFCVEHDRSSQRGNEPLQEFSAASELAPLAQMRLAATRPLLKRESSAGEGNGLTAPRSTRQNETADADEELMMQELGRYLGQNVFQETAEQKAWQNEVWDGVSAVQEGLSKRLGQSMKSNLSPSSLELTLEQAPVWRASDSMVSAFSPAIESDTNAIGIVVAINGRITSADLYGSRKLFSDHVGELLRAATLESIVTHVSGEADSLTTSEVGNFLRNHPTTATIERDLTNRLHIKIWENERDYLFESSDRLAPECYVHRSYIAR